MTSALIHSLESLIAAKRQRLAIARSPRSREIYQREIRMLRLQIDNLKSQEHTSK